MLRIPKPSQIAVSIGECAVKRTHAYQSRYPEARTRLVHFRSEELKVGFSAVVPIQVVRRRTNPSPGNKQKANSLRFRSNFYSRPAYACHASPRLISRLRSRRITPPTTRNFFSLTAQLLRHHPWFPKRLSTLFTVLFAWPKTAVPDCKRI
jgi:hypothetical protein